MSRRIGLIASLGVAVVMAVGSLLSGAVSAIAPGCGEASAIDERDDSFTPWEGRFGYAPERPMQRVGQALDASRLQAAAPFADLPPEVALPLRAEYFVSVDDLDGNGIVEPAVIRYYSDSPWDSGTTFTEFIAAGGVILRIQAPAGMDAQYIADAVGTRATFVEIGPHLGALVHADPISSKGERPYYLTWSDGERDLQLIALAPAASVVNTARSSYCG